MRNRVFLTIVVLFIACAVAVFYMGYKAIQPTSGVIKLTLRQNHAVNLASVETEWIARLFGAPPELIITRGGENLLVDGYRLTGKNVGIAQAYIELFGRKWRQYEIGVVKLKYTAAARGKWGSYNSALADYDFTFDFQRVNAYGTRAIRIEAGWESANIVSMPFLYFDALKVHRLGRTYYENALNAIKNTQVTVRYLDGERRFMLSELVKKDSASGAYNPRYINAPKTPTDEPNVSVHAWGLALDINVSFAVNGQEASNWSKLHDALTRFKLLEDKKVSGVRQVTLRYAGAQPTGEYPVPQATANYLLHELAFADAGFFWGGYFASTDGMHYSLVEKPSRARIPLKKV